jgi:biopolymer transport protein ExbD
MDPTILNADDSQARVKVSVITRLIGVVTYTIPGIGAALGALLMVNLFQSLRTNETAGVGTVMRGMKEASLPLTVSLYLAAACGIALIIVLVIRMIVQTKTASPPFWFFAVGGILSLVPALLFWKAQLLVIEVLSPGSSVGSAGISGVGEEVAQFLTISIIAVPLVFIVLVVLSVLPLTSRPGQKWGSLIVAAFTAVLFIATAVAVPFLIDGPKRKNEIVELPAQIKNAENDYDVEKSTSMVITLGADNKLYQRQSRELPDKVERTETVITREELPAKIKSALEDKTPDKRAVYFKCDVNASYENVLQIFDIIRKADVDRVRLVVVGAKTEDDPYQISPLSFDVRLPEIVDKSSPLKPNPLTLVATLDKDGKLKLNNDDMGTVSDSKRLQTKLAEIFKDRENNGVFREGTNEVEKTVFLKASGPAKYGDFIKLVEAVKTAGAEPIGIQFDDVVPLEIESIDPGKLRPLRK